MQKVVIIGAGFSGLSAACFLAKAGYAVTVVEKHDRPGGRARKFEAGGFTFDMGPSWYWMPDVFERFFKQFGKKTSDYYSLVRLDPSYRVYFENEVIDIPAQYEAVKQLFEQMEPGSAAALDQFLKEAEFKYKTGMQKLVHKPGRSVFELFDPQVIAGVFKLDVFTNMKRHVARYFSDPRLQEIMEFPVLFLGAKAENTPALYSLMNYADIQLGTWYPQGGMYQVVDAMYRLALELGIEFAFNTTASACTVNGKSVVAVETGKGSFKADVVLAAADYNHIEKDLLADEHRNYSDVYWDERTLAPSALIYYIGINQKLPHIQHHNLFFDTDFAVHASEIYDHPQWPSQPLFYVCCTSKTDPTAAPPGCENLFILIPVSTALCDDREEIREHYFNVVMARMEKQWQVNLRNSVIYKRSYAQSDFKADYHAFKGNAYGLANTLRQTANLKPSLKSKRLKNLYFAGQLTVPGPGVPPALISGEVAAKEIMKEFKI